jgi:hypothetical protein
MNDLDLHLFSSLLRVAIQWLVIRRAMGKDNPVIQYDGSWLVAHSSPILA